jgi:DNA-binding transcriptional LysR family regulator
MDSVITSGDFGQIRAFVCVAEALSFSRAAETLGVSHSALSQTIPAFEERVGVRLLNRTTRSVSLTDAGRSLLQRVRPAVAELGQAVGQVSLYRESPAGLVRVLASTLGASFYVEPILVSFNQAYPDVVLDITVDDEVVDIVAGGFDLAVCLGEVIAQDMVAVRLGPTCGRSPSPPRTISRGMADPSRPATWRGTPASAGAGRGAARPTTGNSGARAAGSRSPSTVP